MSGTLAAAGNKPSVAILGVEVTDPSNQGIDQASTETAKGLTEGLRSRAKTGTGPLNLAPGSDKELIDEKMLNSCDAEANVCMAKIGSDLGADQLMFGNIQKKSTGYLVTMKLLGVGGKNIIRSVNETIPYADAQGAPLQSWAKKIYGKLTGDNSGGILVIKANVERGTVLIEGEPKGSLVGGRATISGLPEGKYKLAIEAEGYQRFETSVTINAGDTTNTGATLDPSGLKGGAIKPVDHQPITTTPTTGNPPLHEIGGTVSQSSSSAGWKVTFVVSALVAAGGGGLMIYNSGKITDANNALYTAMPAGFGCTKSTGVCPSTATGVIGGNTVAQWNKIGSNNHDESIVGGVALGLGGALAIVAFYEGFIASHDNNDEHQTVGHRTHRNQFAVTPVLLPNGGGATLQLNW